MMYDILNKFTDPEDEFEGGLDNQITQPIMESYPSYGYPTPTNKYDDVVLGETRSHIFHKLEQQDELKLHFTHPYHKMRT